MKSIFLKKQGASPKNKLLDFLITNSELDYSLKEIAKYSGAGYSTVKILIKKLVKDKWIIPTRKISKIKLYKLNANNPEVKKFIDFFWEVIENELGLNEKNKVKDEHISSYSVNLGSVSTRNV
ncbi:hypothetical protein KY347_04260 [Candidatus Woesearchaeota archaeon]|nr:hypothetical protein [Candidatus Woesearchaeota archaeon]